MTVESATYIGSLNAANPSGSDAKSEGDDHLRLLKSTMLATFPGMTGAMTGTHTQLNKLVSTFSIATAASNAVTIDAGGSIGVGTITPAAKLHVYDATAGFVRADSPLLGTAQLQLATAGVVKWSLYRPISSTDFVLYDNAAAAAAITVKTGGDIISNVNTAAPSLTDNRTMVFSLTSDTNLRVSVRGTDGVTRAANFTLS